jgi:enediyne biosynthesis protein E4
MIQPATVFSVAVLVSACTAASDGPVDRQITADTENLTCWTAPAGGSAGEISFEDRTADAGLEETLTGLRGHAAAFGDVDGNGQVDLFVGTFADRAQEEYRVRGASGASPDVLLRQDGPSFETGDFPDVYGRTSGAVFADLDGDGQLDLVVARNPRPGERQTPPTTVYANRGSGRFDVVEDSGVDPSLGGRSVGVLDFDGDHQLDLFLVEDVYEGGSSRLYRNVGNLRFEDATDAAGLPTDIHGLGLATGDINLDGLTDMFVGGSNRLFTGTGTGFEEATSDVFTWETYGDEDLVAGAAFGDVNRDGWPDLVVGHHFNSTVDFGESVPVRLYLNRTAEPGDVPEFADVTEEAGLVGLPTKAPHVALVDLDNDGWPDLVTTAAASDGTRPAIFRHTGELVDGVPTFSPPDGVGEPQYWVSGPAADVDRDGRMDLFLVEWEPSIPSLFLHNTGEVGHWVSVSIGPQLGGGVGTRIAAYTSGHANVTDHLLASTEIVASAGYGSGNELVAHLGLGSASVIDLVVIPPTGRPIVLPDLAADRHLRLPEGC